ncbi:hypothetical protein [Bacillus sp. PS06]|uniref:hypothetical protein n=1 Tax=Bacillus sp. PS06 TaxID=2764176 RepID=UPI00177DC6AE|nr:hypothetical protein [Bacillus sp. PS06]MBD8069148.1 hypothetical protein [Bacillus sp. PS06]
MSKNGLRAFASGMILATSILSAFYFFEEDKVVSSEVSDQDVEEYINKRGDLILIDQTEYESLLQLRETVESQQPQEEKVQEEVEEETQAQEPTDLVITKYTLEIQSGMTSLEIARQLENVEIIEDATKLNEYILEQNLAEKIQIGSYQLTSDMTNQEIAALITK